MGSSSVSVAAPSMLGLVSYTEDDDEDDVVPPRDTAPASHTSAQMDSFLAEIHAIPDSSTGQGPSAASAAPDLKSVGTIAPPPGLKPKARSNMKLSPDTRDDTASGVASANSISMAAVEWLEVPDPSGSGKMYYWNSRTNATSWTKPSAYKAASEADTALLVASSTAAPAAMHAAQASTSAWEVAIEAASGKEYYWNTITGEVTWTKPDTINSETAPSRYRGLLYLVQYAQH